MLESRTEKTDQTNALCVLQRVDTQMDAIFALTYIPLSYPFVCVTTKMHVGGGELYFEDVK